MEVLFGIKTIFEVMKRILLIAVASLFLPGAGGQQPAKLVLRIDAGAAHPLHPGIVSLAGTYTLGGLTLDDPALARIMQTVRPPFFRIPGGDTMNYWDWNAGAVRTAEQMKASGANPDSVKASGVLKSRAAYLEKMGGPMVAERWVSLAKQGGSEPIWGLNITTMSPEDTRRFMLHLKAAHLPATHFELGNELNFAKLWAEVIPDVQAYIQKAKAHAREVKAVFPQAIVAVCTSIPISAGQNQGPQQPGPWSEALAKESFYDAVIFHSYAFVSEAGDLRKNSAADFTRYAVVRSSAPMLQGMLRYEERLFPARRSGKRNGT